MALHPAGITSDLSLTAAAAGHQLELNPVPPVIQITEVGISVNAAPNSTAAPIAWLMHRTSVAGTGGVAGTAVALQSDLTAGLTTTVLRRVTAPGTDVDDLHRFSVPNVSGFIWVAAPGREYDCVAAEFIAIENEAAIPAGLNSSTYMVWEE